MPEYKKPFLIRLSPPNRFGTRQNGMSCKSSAVAAVGHISFIRVRSALRVCLRT